MGRIPDAPAINDPVVVDGTKYRIRSIGPQSGLVQLRTSFGGRETTCLLRELTWDKVAGVWRRAT